MTISPDIAIERRTCRASGGPLTDVFDLGPICLNAFLRPGEPDPPRVPLTLAYNEESGLAQLRHSVDPDMMFSTYWYRSGTNEMMRAHLAGIVQDILQRIELQAGDSVLDIGCNDGTMLRNYPDSIMRVGIDPADVDSGDGVSRVKDYFDAKHFRPHSFKIVTSIAMLYDVEDPVAFAQDVATVLADDGIWVTEQHYLHAMLDSNGFDAICHEHLTYLSLRSLDYIVKQAGLRIEDVTFNGSNGGSFRAVISKPTRRRVNDQMVENAQRQIAEEPEPDFAAFQRRVDNNGDVLRYLIDGMRYRGVVYGGIGASTKFNTTLQYYRLNLPWISERMPEKVGLETPWTRIPIISDYDMRDMMPDVLIVGPYHFIDGLVRREAEFVERGGRFIVPCPYPRMVG